MLEDYNDATEKIRTCAEEQAKESGAAQKIVSMFLDKSPLAGSGQPKKADKAEKNTDTDDPGHDAQNSETHEISSAENNSNINSNDKGTDDHKNFTGPRILWFFNSKQIWSPGT